MPNQADIDQLLATLRVHGTASARDLATALGKSQPSISRLLAATAEHVAQWGHARRTRYAATRDVHGLGSDWPIYRIDAQGRAHAFAQLITLHQDACLVKTSTSPDWIRGEFIDGCFPGLPWFLDDMRPQGFLGRQFAHGVGKDLGLSDDLHIWGANAVLTALLLRGADTPGNFVVGDQSLRNALQSPPPTITVAERSIVYAQLADAAMAGEVLGSSAAGEQPKFTTRVTESNGDWRHVIVKFSERTTNNPVAQRWADLLVAEHVATQVLAAHGHASAHTELIVSNERLCLEATRFDRTGHYGRRGTITLAAWSDAHDGLRDNWAAAATRMQANQWISADTVEQIRLRWWFGRLIGNTDMHFGNLAFYLDDHLPLQLAPCYDMLPMRYAPGSSGAMHTQPLAPPPMPLPTERDAWVSAAAIALTYWQTLADTDQLQADFRRIAAENGKILAQAIMHT